MIFALIHAVQLTLGLSLQPLAEAVLPRDSYLAVSNDHSVYAITRFGSQGCTIERKTKPYWKRTITNLPGAYVSCAVNKRAIVFYRSWSPGGLLALDPKTGATLWKDQTVRPLPYAWVFNQSAMTLHNEVVYLVDSEQIEARVLTTGSLLWKTPLGGGHGVHHVAPPLVSGNSVFVLTPGKATPSHDLELKVTAMEAARGQVLWSKPFGQVPSWDEPLVYHIPNLVPFGGSIVGLRWRGLSELVALSQRDGELVWVRPTGLTSVAYDWKLSHYGRWLTVHSEFESKASLHYLGSGAMIGTLSSVDGVGSANYGLLILSKHGRYSLSRYSLWSGKFELVKTLPDSIDSAELLERGGEILLRTREKRRYSLTERRYSYPERLFRVVPPAITKDFTSTVSEFIGGG